MKTTVTPFLLSLMLSLPAAGFALGFESQDDQPFRVTSEIALVDLIVTDDNGDPVTDLEPKDLRLREGGKERKVLFLQSARAFQFAEAPREFDPQLTPNRRVPFVFVFDLNSLDAATLLKCKEAVREFCLSGLSATEVPMLAVVEESLSIVRPFSTDGEQLLEALDTISSARGILTYNDLLVQFSNIIRTIPDPLEEGIIAAREFIREVNNRQADLLEGLARLAEHLQTLRGRKNVILYTAGYPSNIEGTVMEMVTAMPWRVRTLPGDSPRAVLSAKLGGALGSPAAAAYSEALQRINSNQTSVYVVDARGLLGPTLHSARETPGLPIQISARFRSESITSPQGFIKALASDTGALSYLNQNEWIRGAEQALIDSREYFLVGYVPASSRSGDRKRLEIEPLRPGLKIRRRGDFFTLPVAEPDQEINNAFKFPALYEDFPFTVDLRTAPGKLAVEAKIPTTSVVFRNHNGVRENTFGFYGALVNRQGEWVGGGFAFARKFPVKLSQDKFETFRSMETVSTPAEAGAEPGDYELIVVLTQESAGLLSSFRTRVSIPE